MKPCRGLGKMEEAQIVLAHSLELAEERDDPALLADLYQRASYIMAHRSEAQAALALSERATLNYVSLPPLSPLDPGLLS